MEYNTIGDIRELVTAGIVTGARGISWDNGTISALSEYFAIPFYKIKFSEYASRL